MNHYLGVGLGERDIALRLLALGVVVLFAFACVFAFIWMVLHWPLWMALPCGLAALVFGVGISIFVVSLIVPKKVKSSRTRFGDEQL